MFLLPSLEFLNSTFAIVFFPFSAHWWNQVKISAYSPLRCQTLSLASTSKVLCVHSKQWYYPRLGLKVMLSTSFFVWFSVMELCRAPEGPTHIEVCLNGTPWNWRTQPVWQNAAALNAVCNNWQIQKKKIINFYCAPAIYLLTNTGCFYLRPVLCSVGRVGNEFWGIPCGFSELTISDNFTF